MQKASQFEDSTRDALARIEAKLDALIVALAAEAEDGPVFDLEGQRIPARREDGETL